MNKKKPPQKPAERRAWIKYRLELAGYTLAKLSKKHGLYRTAAANALGTPYPKMERIIADILGYGPEEIWPERYAEKQTTRRRRRRQ